MQPDAFYRPSFPPGIAALQGDNVLIHRSAENELNTLFSCNADCIGQLLAQYLKRLQELSQNLGKETVHREWFEALKHTAPYRAIRFRSVNLGNLRILYCIADGKAYLLVSFQEKNRADYSRAIAVAKERAKLL